MAAHDFPLPIKQLLLTHQGVAEVAVIGLPDPKWGERPTAVVVPRAGATLDAADIKAQVKRQTELGIVSKYAVPQSVFFVEELPKTSVGKIDKKGLRLSIALLALETALPASTPEGTTTNV
jgi:fatty-acyl-CoA synthase